MYEVIQSFSTALCSAKQRKGLRYLRAFSEEPTMSSAPVSPANLAHKAVVQGSVVASAGCCHLRRSFSLTSGRSSSEEFRDVCVIPSTSDLCDTGDSSTVTDQNVVKKDKNVGLVDKDSEHIEAKVGGGIVNFSTTYEGQADMDQTLNERDTPPRQVHSLLNNDTAVLSQSVNCVTTNLELRSNMSEEVTIPGRTVVELVKHWGTTPDNQTPAFVSVDASDRKRQINRKEVLDFAKRFAYKLKDLGIKKGDIVCNALPNSLERVVCEFGIQFSGATSMNGQIFRSDGEDFMDALKVSGCCAVICDPGVPKGARHVLLKEVPQGCESDVRSDRLPDLKRLIICARDDSCAETDFLTSLQNPLLPEYTAFVQPADLSTVMTTSGSTGYSKLVKLTHSNICHFGIQVKAIEPLAGGDHFINCAPLGWAGGYPQWYLSCGVTRYFLDLHDGPIPDLPALVWRTIVEEKIVYGFLSPMYVNAILTNCPWQNSSWKPRTLCLAGQLVKKGLLDIIGKLCDSVDINYGITECNLVSTHRIRDPSSYLDGCAGSPGYGVVVKVVDKDRKDVAWGTKGEILLWSPALSSGYLNDDAATDSAFTSDGWFCTDDAGFIAPDGKLYVEGRQSDTIMRGAYILYPAWLEKKMREFPGVKDVVIVPVPDKILYNEICACVVVGGVKGVLAGITESSESDTSGSSTSSSSRDEDEIDNTAFVNRRPTFSSSTCRSLPESPATYEEIRKEGLSRPLTVTYNVMKVKESSLQAFKEERERRLQNGEITTNSDGLPDLRTFEIKLREHANKLQLLHEKDAMLMVPKYYVFMESLPLTATGKVIRREVRKIATSVLGLDS